MISNEKYLIRKVVKTSDNRKIIYFPCSFLTSEYVVIKKRNNKIIIEPVVVKR